MKEKWKAGKKGYLKIHVAVNVKTKKKNSSFHEGGNRRRARSMNSSKELPELVDNIIKSDSIR